MGISLLQFNMVGMGFTKQILSQLVRMKPIKGITKKYANKIKYDMQRFIPVSKGGGTAMEDIQVKELYAMNDAIGLAIGTDITRERDSAGATIVPFYYPLALEYGTRNIRVGTPASPRRSWVSKASGHPTGRMPFARPAFYKHRDDMIKEITESISLIIKKMQAAGITPATGGLYTTTKGLRVIR